MRGMGGGEGGQPFLFSGVPHLDTRGVGRILESYANPRLHLGSAYNFREFSQPRECSD